MDPLAPLALDPEPIRNEPELPEATDPVKSVKAPLSSPSRPAPVDTFTLPLEASELAPLTIEIEPPTDEPPLEPPEIEIVLPTPLLLSPPLTFTAPASLEIEFPLPIRTTPDEPSAALPLISLTMPLFPLPSVSEEPNQRLPLFAEDELLPPPLSIDTSPPSDTPLPPFTDTEPPAAEP
jgi:hypothetical protein